MYTQFWSENLKERNHVEDLRLDGRITPESILGKDTEKLWTGCIWLRIATICGLL